MSSARRPALASVVAVAMIALLHGATARAEDLRPDDAPIGPDAYTTAPPALPSGYLDLDLEGIRFAYHPSTRERIRPLFDRAGAIRAALAEATGAPVLRDVEVRVAAVPAEMVQLAPGSVTPSASAVAFSAHRLVVMTVVAPGSSSPLDVESAFTHALAHVALDQAGGASLPAWFHESFATHAEGGDLERRRVLIESTVFGEPPSLDDLARSGREVERAHGADLVRFLSGATDRAGHPALPSLLRSTSKGTPFNVALPAALDAPDLPTVEAQWRADRARRHAFAPVLLGLLCVMALCAATWRWAIRSRRAAVERSAPDRPRAQPQVVRAPAKTARPRAKVAAAARALAVRGKDAAIHVPREPEVPKVEHNGEWHTLH